MSKLWHNSGLKKTLELIKIVKCLTICFCGGGGLGAGVGFTAGWLDTPSCSSWYGGGRSGFGSLCCWLSSPCSSVVFSGVLLVTEVWWK